MLEEVDFMKTLKYELEVISPLNIGDGNKYQNFEYRYDERNNTVDFIDFLELLDKSANLRSFIDYFTGAIGSPDFSWDNVVNAYRINLNNFIKYSVKVNNIPRVKGEIISFVKTAKGPYIPGTSIKGAIRTSLTRSMWDIQNKRKEVDIYNKRIEESLKKLEISNNDNNRKYFSVNAERGVFGNPQESPFRFLKISDSNVLSYGDICVSEMKILNICNNKVKWYRRGNNVERSTEGMSIYAETLKEGVKARGYIKLNGDIYAKLCGLFKEEIKNLDLLDGLVQKIRSDISFYIHNEINFYNRYGISEVADFYKKLSSIELKEGEFIIQLGYGTGFLSKTLNLKLNKEFVEKVARCLYRNIDRNIFPKTRRIIFKNGKPYSVPGWVKICIK